MKRILQAVTELWVGQEYSLRQISISSWPPGSQVFRVQMCHNPKRHIYTSWGSYMCNMKRILLAVTEVWAGQEYNLAPLGDKVMESNESFIPKGTSRPLRGPTRAIWKESSQRLQSYGPDKNITLTAWGTRSWGQMSHFPWKAHLDPLGVLHV